MSKKAKRLVAAFIDFYLILFIALLVVSILSSGRLHISTVTVCAFLLTFLFASIFRDLVFKNASIGKKLFKLQILRNNGAKATFSDILKRNLPLVVFPLELLLILFKNQRLGDLFSKTIVK